MVPKCTQIKALAVFLGVYYAPFSHPGPWVGRGEHVEAISQKGSYQKTLGGWSPLKVVHFGFDT